MIPIPTPPNVPVEVLKALQMATVGERFSAMLLACKEAWNTKPLETNPPVKEHFIMLQSHFLTRACQLLPPGWLACRGILPDRLLLMNGEQIIEWFEDKKKGLEE